jgi:REP element-mobilizing transposase RayT
MSQSLSTLLTHIVFSTKNRQLFIDPRIEPELYAYIVHISKKNKCFIHRIGGLEDHIHILLDLHRTISISGYIEDIKKNSSRWIKTKGFQYNAFGWQNGYAAFSACSTHLEPLKKYIENQKEQHKATNLSFQDEYRHLLNKNNVAFDEKYVWD